MGSGKKRGPVALAELVGRALDPITARRGFAIAELNASWAEIVGARYADCSRPDRIVWPRGAANEGKAATLVVRIDGPRSLFFQHESAQIMQRVNGFLGQDTIGKINIVQGPVAVSPPPQQPRQPAPLASEDLSNLEGVLSQVDDENLRSALDRLGRAVLADRDK